MRNKELEKQLKKETEQLFVSNKMAIYKKLGIAFSDEKKVLSSLETQIKKEADVFVPNKKTEIMASVKANEIKNASTIYVEQRLMDESDEFVPFLTTIFCGFFIPSLLIVILKETFDVFFADFSTIIES